MTKILLGALFVVSLCAINITAGDGKKDNSPPPGFTALFNGKDLTGWQGLIEIPQRAKMTKEQLEAAQKKANERILPHWTVKDGMLEYDGKGHSLQTVKDYGDIELYVDWKIGPKGDSGIYLRGNPQVQIWDSKEGSGGLYNNRPALRLTLESLAALKRDDLPENIVTRLEKVLDSKFKAEAVFSKAVAEQLKAEEIKKFGPLIRKRAEVNRKLTGAEPLVFADNPPGQWNTFHIVMKGNKVSVKLNDKLVVDNKSLDNYWELNAPLPTMGPIELQHHGDPLWFKNIYIKELKE